MNLLNRNDWNKENEQDKHLTTNELFSAITALTPQQR
jgi:hypothetical protein